MKNKIKISSENYSDISKEINSKELFESIEYGECYKVNVVPAERNGYSAVVRVIGKYMNDEEIGIIIEDAVIHEYKSEGMCHIELYGFLGGNGFYYDGDERILDNCTMIDLDAPVVNDPSADLTSEEIEEAKKDFDGEEITFTLNKVEALRFHAFHKKHRECCRKELGKDVYSSTGGGYSIIVTPTGLGPCFSVKCNSCGKVEDITDIDSW